MKNEFYYKLINKFENYFKKQNINNSLLGAVDLIILSILLFFSLTVLEFLFYFSPTIRTVMVIFWSTIIIGFLFINVIIPILKNIKILPSRNYFQIAQTTGNYFPEIKDELLNALQLVFANNTILYSAQLIDEAFKRIYYKVENLDFESIIDKNILKIKTQNLFLTLIPLIILIFLNTGLLSAGNRLLNFNVDFIPPNQFYFDVQPGNVTISKGTPVEIRIKVIGKQPSEVYLMTKEDDEAEYNKIRLLKDTIGNYYYSIKNTLKPFNYFAYSEGVKSTVFKVDVTDFPIIKTLSVQIVSPSYSKIQTLQQYDNGNITALKGSQVDLKITSSKELKEAFIEFSDLKKIPLQIKGNFAETKFTVNQDINYVIRISDLSGNRNEDPIKYSINTIIDEFPTIELKYPNSDFNLKEDNRVPINLKIQDDYGFSKLLLHFTKFSLLDNTSKNNNYKSFQINIDKDIKEQIVSYIWNLTSESPSVEDIFSFYLEIFDNDIISGPKSSKTQIINIRIPSLDELFSEIRDSQQDVQQQLEETLKQAEDLKKELEQISKELRQDKKELKWEEKQRIEKALDKFENLHQQIQQSTEKLKDVQNELQQNKLLSKETLEKYMQLQELIEEITSDEMKKTLNKLRQHLEQMNRQLAQQQLKEFQFDEEQLRKSIERTLNLLKLIQIEQSIDELMKRTENVEQALEKLSNQMNNNNYDKKQLSQNQDKITKDFDEIEKAIKDLENKMKDMENVPLDKVEKLQQEFQSQENQQLSEEASKSINQNQMQKARNNQQQLAKNIDQLQKMIEEVKDSMLQENLIQTFTDLMRITENLISLSKKQEELKNRTQKIDVNSTQMNSSAKQQNEIKENLNKIIEQLSKISQRTFAVTPEMGKVLGDAQLNMDKAVSLLQNRNPALSSIQQQESMGNINRAIMFLRNQIEAMMQGKGGGKSGGMLSLMQQLQQLASQQMNLNNLTQMLQQLQQQGKLSLQQQAELQRLAQQQELIKKSIEQLNKEAQLSGISKKLPTNLEQIAKQMQEVITQMQSQRVDDQLIQKQEHILSKLLDAQKSINQRDFTQERKGETAQNILRKSPADINLTVEQKKDRLRNELKNYIQEKYNKDFEELIKKYFELLQSIKN